VAADADPRETRRKTGPGQADGIAPGRRRASPATGRQGHSRGQFGAVKAALGTSARRWRASRSEARGRRSVVRARQVGPRADRCRKGGRVEGVRSAGGSGSRAERLLVLESSSVGGSCRRAPSRETRAAEMAPGVASTPGTTASAGRVGEQPFRIPLGYTSLDESARRFTCRSPLQQGAPSSRAGTTGGSNSHTRTLEAANRAGTNHFNARCHRAGSIRGGTVSRPGDAAAARSPGSQPRPHRHGLGAQVPSQSRSADRRPRHRVLLRSQSPFRQGQSNRARHHGTDAWHSNKELT